MHPIRAAGVTACLALTCLAAGCGADEPGTDGIPADQTQTARSEPVNQAPFGVTPDGQQVTLYTLTNANGVEARVINYGGIIVSLRVPDRDGNLEDVVLGFDSLEGYVDEHPYFGAIIGRYGNRIANGRFTLDGETHQRARALCLEAGDHGVGLASS